MIRLTPTNSNNWLTDGQSFAKVVDTQQSNASKWYEITEEEYQQRIAPQEEEQITDEEYQQRIAPQEEEQITDEEALNIILGR